MLTIVVYALLSTSLFYLGSRALITRFLWSRYPRWLATFMDCPACVGFWWGLGLSLALGDGHELDGLISDHVNSYDFLRGCHNTSLLIGLISIVTTPIVAGIMQRAFDYLGSAVPPDDAA